MPVSLLYRTGKKCQTSVFVECDVVFEGPLQISEFQVSRTFPSKYSAPGIVQTGSGDRPEVILVDDVRPRDRRRKFIDVLDLPPLFDGIDSCQRIGIQHLIDSDFDVGQLLPFVGRHKRDGRSMAFR